MRKQVLVADVGGTNTRVALAVAGVVDTTSVARFTNADHPSLEAVLRRYHQDQGQPAIFAAACAIAGPVEGDRGRLTNLDWDIDSARLRAATGAAHGAVMNDLVAQGHALGHLPVSAFRPLVTGSEPPLSGVQLVIGIGTGFNAAPVHDTASGRVVAASECGHITLPALSTEDRALADDLSHQHGFPGVEDVLSGRGMLALYHREGAPASARSTDFAAALAAGEAVAVRAADRFARVLGMVIGDLALVHLPFGGIHLVGGVARALAPRLAHPVDGAALREALYAKGRFSDFLRRFSVDLIEDDFAALTGMAAHLHRTASL